MALSEADVRHFEAFGAVVLRGVFTPREMERLTASAEEIWAANRAEYAEVGEVAPDEHRHRWRIRNGSADQSCGGLLEHRPELIALAADERIWGVARRLLGEGFVWVGSEGNVSSLETFNWHSDRKYYNHPNFAAAGDPSLLPPHFTQLKMMLYLEELGPETGCLNCIVGSHKSPLHEALGPQEHGRAENPTPFGAEAEELPRWPLPSRPGDVICFAHTLFHSVFNARGGKPPRRYLTLKFAQRPRTAAQLFTLLRYTPTVIRPASTLAGSASPRLRALVQPWLRLREAIGEEMAEELAGTTQAGWTQAEAGGWGLGEALEAAVGEGGAFAAPCAAL